MICIKMGSDESHFNVSFIVRDKVTRPCPQTTTGGRPGLLSLIKPTVSVYVKQHFNINDLGSLSGDTEKGNSLARSWMDEW